MKQDTPLDSIGKAKKPFDLFGVIGRYFRLVALCGSISFLCLAPLAFLLSKPYYQATGRILIERVIEPFIARTEQMPISNFFYDYAQTEVQRILHHSVLQRALETLPVELQAVYAPHGINPAAIEGLRRSLIVGLIPSTHLIMVQIKTGAPQGTADIVNAIMAAYLEHSEQIEENKDARRLTYLLEERNALKREVDGLTAKLSSLAGEAKTASFAETFNVESRQLLEMQKAWVQAKRQRIEYENKLEQTGDKVQRIRDLPTQSLADELVANDESLWSISYWTYKTLQEMRASVDGIDPKNPDRRYVEDRMRAMQAYETNLKKKVEGRAARVVNDRRDYELDKELISIEAEYKAAAKTELVLFKQLKKAQQDSATNSRRIIRGQQLAALLTTARGRLNNVEARIQEIRAESKAPLRVSIEQEASAPNGPAGNNKKKLLILFFGASFGSIGMLVLGIEFGDDRMRSSKDIVHATGHPPNWPISKWDGEIPVHMLITQEPASQHAKAFRSLGIRLNNERIRHNAKLAVFAGIERYTGTTTIAMNAAAAMTSFCSKVLLVEATGGANSIHSLLHLSEHVGIGECLLQEDTSLSSCIIQHEDVAFDILPMGTAWSSNKNSDFGELIAQCKKEYDFIVVDAAPVLQSDKTEFLFLQTDIATIVTQGNRTRYTSFRQALEILLRLQVPSISTVLNWGAPRSMNTAERIISKFPSRMVSLLMPELRKGSYLDDYIVKQKDESQDSQSQTAESEFEDGSENNKEQQA